MSSALREARIDLGALRSNLTILRGKVAPSRVLGVVKAQGYGHGAVGVARALAEEGVDWLGVADLAEALELRAAGIATPILAWLHGPDVDAEAAAEHDIDLGVSTIDQLERAAAAGATVQLKLDTGLSRNGFAPAEAITAFARAADHERHGRLRVRGVFSHLSNTSPDDDAAQTGLFSELVDAARDAGLDPELRHLAATQAALTRPDSRLDLVRLGIGLYGIEYGDPQVSMGNYLRVMSVLGISGELALLAGDALQPGPAGTAAARSCGAPSIQPSSTAAPLSSPMSSTSSNRSRASSGTGCRRLA